MTKEIKLTAGSAVVAKAKKLDITPLTPWKGGNHCSAPESHWDSEHRPDEEFDKIEVVFSYDGVVYVQMRLCRNCGCFYANTHTEVEK
jgi:hypothetical protein